jgi:hypothetical protein
MLERDSLKMLDGEAGDFMVMPGGMTIRPNGQAGIACPVLRSEQAAKTGSWPFRPARILFEGFP